MRQAAQLESRSEKSPISPGPILPARQLLGEMLIEVKQFAAALKEFEASQEREPNHFRGYYGARAAEGAGDNAKAAEHYRKLLTLAAKADGERKELMHARAVVNTSSSARTSGAH
jgi:predicted Zn-dependent protease